MMKMALQFGDLNDIVMEQFSSGGGTTVRAALPIAFEMAMKPERREAITNALRAENQGNQDLKQALTTFNATLPLEKTEY